jgi:hypothetical protein
MHRPRVNHTAGIIRLALAVVVAGLAMHFFPPAAVPGLVLVGVCIELA